MLFLTWILNQCIKLQNIAYLTKSPFAMIKKSYPYNPTKFGTHDMCMIKLAVKKSKKNA